MKGKEMMIYTRQSKTNGNAMANRLVHSGVIATRDFPQDDGGRRCDGKREEACNFFSRWDIDGDAIGPIDLGQHFYHTMLHDIQSFGPKVSLTLETPLIIRSDPIA